MPNVAGPWKEEAASWARIPGGSSRCGAVMSPVWQCQGVNVNPSVVLKGSGYRAIIEVDRWMPGSFTLVVDGTPQSHVNLENPSQLFFEYIQRMGTVIDQLKTPGGPITAVHLGAGALTLPRYIEATRPGSRQQVIELEPDLVDLVRAELPWPKHASIRVRYGDARDMIGRLPSGLAGAVDLLVVDIFAGARTPAHVTSAEFYRDAVKLLAGKGVMLVNIADGPGLAFARSQVATVASVMKDVAVLAEAQVLKGRRFGNVVIAGSRATLPLTWMPRLLAGGPHPAKVLTGRELKDWTAGALVVTDESATASPLPSAGIFHTRP